MVKMKIIEYIKSALRMESRNAFVLHYKLEVISSFAKNTAFHIFVGIDSNANVKFKLPSYLPPLTELLYALAVSGCYFFEQFSFLRSSSRYFSKRASSVGISAQSFVHVDR